MDKDQLIITGIINGDERVLRDFYNDNLGYVHSYILRNSGNEADVEDVFQDAMVVLYQKLRSGWTTLSASIKTYFYGICKNIWRNRLRNNKKLIADNGQLGKEGANDSLNIDIENEEREHLYRKYFQKLSVDKKNLLLLFFERKSVKEISKITGYSEGYVRKKKFEAKKQLLKMIEKDPVYRELKVAS